jgi:hypothetical protein
MSYHEKSGKPVAECGFDQAIKNAYDCQLISIRLAEHKTSLHTHYLSLIYPVGKMEKNFYAQVLPNEILKMKRVKIG